jgi:hypothetical protein
MPMRFLERYVNALMVFVFGFGFIGLPAAWLKRGNFMAGTQLISKSIDPTAFWRVVIPLWILGAVLMCFGIYLAFRISRSPAQEVPRSVASRVVRRIVALWFIGWSVMQLVHLLR